MTELQLLSALEDAGREYERLFEEHEGLLDDLGRCEALVDELRDELTALYAAFSQRAPEAAGCALSAMPRLREAL